MTNLNTTENTTIARWESAGGRFFLELRADTDPRNAQFLPEGKTGFFIESSSFQKAIFAVDQAAAITEAEGQVFMVETGRNKNPIQRTI